MVNLRLDTIHGYVCIRYTYIPPILHIINVKPFHQKQYNILCLKHIKKNETGKSPLYIDLRIILLPPRLNFQ